MPDALILDAVRTPIGRYGGVLSTARPDDLAAHADEGPRPNTSPERLASLAAAARATAWRPCASAWARGWPP